MRADVQDPGKYSLRDPGAEELSDLVIEVSFVLLVARVRGGAGEGLLALSAGEALNPAGVRLTVEPAAASFTNEGHRLEQQQDGPVLE